ncbi:MAG: Holliday junction branch migration protein RuvA [Salinisphaeraceae bacterium]|nr:Holliday junction branch migration protein RuvA [Salinisphaeraceae bacterium]
MIGRLQGRIVERQPPFLVIDVQGVGYEVEAPLSTFFAMDGQSDSVNLHIHMVVREDAMLLYGFATLAEKKLFRELLKVSRFGPKMALTILSGCSVSEFASTVAAGDAARLSGLPGIGKKTAERLIVEMRDRLGKQPAEFSGLAGPDAASAPTNDALGEAHNALTALGYKPAEADRLLKGLETDLPSKELIRQALRKAVR